MLFIIAIIAQAKAPAPVVLLDKLSKQLSYLLTNLIFR